MKEIKQEVSFLTATVCPNDVIEEKAKSVSQTMKKKAKAKKGKEKKKKKNQVTDLLSRWVGR